jgi:hypothetical protein
MPSAITRCLRFLPIPSIPPLFRHRRPSESWRTHSTSNRPLPASASTARIPSEAAALSSIRSTLLLRDFPGTVFEKTVALLVRLSMHISRGVAAAIPASPPRGRRVIQNPELEGVSSETSFTKPIAGVTFCTPRSYYIQSHDGGPTSGPRTHPAKHRRAPARRSCAGGSVEIRRSLRASFRSHLFLCGKSRSRPRHRRRSNLGSVSQSARQSSRL